MSDKAANDIEYRRLVEQEALILEVTEAIYEIMEEKGVTKAELARDLGKTRGYVSQILNGGRNMTLRTLSDVLWALDERMRFTTEARA